MSEGVKWRQVGGNVAEAYQQNLVPAMFAPWAPKTVDAAGVQPGERVLDVACGTGVVTRIVAERVGPAGQVTGLDVNAAMLSVARATPAPAGALIDWIEASALEMPIPDGSYDVVLCQQGLQQIPDHLGALREMRRVLTPGGRLAIAVWGPIEQNPGMAALVEALERHVGPEAARNRRGPFALGDGARVQGLIEEAGFRDVQLRTLTVTGRFPSPESIFTYQAAATPLSTTGEIINETRRAIEDDMRLALAPYMRDSAFAVPTTAHLATARA